MYRLLLTVLLAGVCIQAYQNSDEVGPSYMHVEGSNAAENTVNDNSLINLMPQAKVNGLFHSFLGKISDHVAEHINTSFRGSLDHITNACEKVLSTTTNQTVMSQHVEEGLKIMMEKAGSGVIKRGLLSAFSKFMPKN